VALDDPQMSEAMLRAITDVAIEGIIIADSDGKIVSANPAAEAMFGYRTGAMAGRSATELAATESVSTVQRSYETGREHSYSAMARRRDGTHFRVEVRTRNVEVGDRALRAAVIRDCSEQDQIDRERAESIALLRSTIESTTDGIIVCDTQWRVTLYNERFRTMFSLPDPVPPLAEGMAIVEKQMIEPARFRGRIRDLVESPTAEGKELLEFKDGRVIERYTCPQRLGDQILGRIFILRDVTEQQLASSYIEIYFNII
jgi:PAS domain S-box-containing protein